MPGKVPVDEHVVFVHGTWTHGVLRSLLWRLLPESRRAALRVRWGALRDALVARGATVHDDFVWSGRNSRKARMEAGDRLAERLEEIAEPGARVRLIAHSHGGNVALYALGSGRLRAEIAGLACLATPFLYFEPRRLDLSILRAQPLALGVLALAFSYPLAFLVLPARDAVGAVEVLLGLVFAIAMFLAAAVAARGGVRRLARGMEGAQEKARQWEPGIPDGVEVRALWMTGDEASAALMAGRLAEWLVTRIWRTIDAVGRTIALVGFSPSGLVFTLGLLGGVLWYLRTAAPDGSVAGTILLALLIAVALAGGLQMLLALGLVAVNLLRFGSDDALSAMFIRVTVAEVRPEVGQWCFYRTAGSDPLEHCEIYSHPKVIEDLVGWVLGDER